jgi:cytochrome bd-type quinol oxidase subunit 2
VFFFVIIQAVMYAVSAVVSAYFFTMWKRADADVKSRVWRRYGWFSALAFFGSIAGLVTAAADIQLRYIFQRAILSSRDIKCDRLKLPLAKLDCFQEPVSNYVQTLKRLSVSPVPYAIEFLCICCANLLVRLLLSLSARRRLPFSPLPT